MSFSLDASKIKVYVNTCYREILNLEEKVKILREALDHYKNEEIQDTVSEEVGVLLVEIQNNIEHIKAVLEERTRYIEEARTKMIEIETKGVH